MRSFGKCSTCVGVVVDMLDRMSFNLALCFPFPSCSKQELKVFSLRAEVLLELDALSPIPYFELQV